MTSPPKPPLAAQESELVSLRSENAALRSELQVRTDNYDYQRQRGDHYEAKARQARVEVLEWAVKQAIMHDCDGVFGAVSVHALEAEIARLRALE